MNSIKQYMCVLSLKKTKQINFIHILISTPSLAYSNIFIQYFTLTYNRNTLCFSHPCLLLVPNADKSNLSGIILLFSNTTYCKHIVCKKYSRLYVFDEERIEE